MFRTITGSQFGDEGKGKLVDWLSEDADIVVRFQGGDNAGHTVKVEETTLKLSLIPSAVLNDKRLLLGAGMSVNPGKVEEEIEELKKTGRTITPEMLGIDLNASVIMPYHIKMDELVEEQRENSIGTTKRGIGNAYQDKASRDEIRVSDFRDEERFRSKVEEILSKKEERIKELGGDFEDLKQKSLSYIQKYSDLMTEYSTDVSREIHEALEEGRKVLAEGAQGTFLDVLNGTHKYVTSSHTTAGAVCPYLGIGPSHVDSAAGVMKAYITRVGKGPLPTELGGETGETLREKGGEFGTNTGRPRRCGWLDLILGKKAVNLNGYDWIALTKLDVLSGFEEIKICTAYKKDGEKLVYPPATSEDLENVEPIYETVEGWDEDITDAESMEDLPENARKYVEKVEKTLGTEIKVVSVGPKRSQTIIRKEL